MDLGWQELHHPPALSLEDLVRSAHPLAVGVTARVCTLGLWAGRVRGPPVQNGHAQGPAGSAPGRSGHGAELGEKPRTGSPSGGRRDRRVLALSTKPRSRYDFIIKKQ